MFRTLNQWTFYNQWALKCDDGQESFNKLEAISTNVYNLWKKWTKKWIVCYLIFEHSSPKSQWLDDRRKFISENVNNKIYGDTAGECEDSWRKEQCVEDQWVVFLIRQDHWEEAGEAAPFYSQVSLK